MPVVAQFEMATHKNARLWAAKCVIEDGRRFCVAPALRREVPFG